VDAILAAADALFAEVGFEAATTNAIAARGGMAIGSLYQFFPDKAAILHALAERYLADLRAVADAMLGPDAALLPLPALVDRVVDLLAAFYAAHPGVRPLVRGAAPGTPLAAEARRLHDAFVARVEGLIAIRVPELADERRRLAATLCVEVVKGVLPLTAAAGAALGPAVVSEVKVLLLAYLETLETPDASPAWRRHHGSQGDPDTDVGGGCPGPKPPG
jgi:AcrR family transcriptional regulator